MQGASMKTYFNRLRDLREDNDLTQTQVASLLGTSQTMYARYERGRFGTCGPFACFTTSPPTSS